MTRACALAVLAGLVLGCDALPVDAPEPRFSLLALGDTGLAPEKHDGQHVVARGLAFEDERRPSDALVLLGDNFYPNGLVADELAVRIEWNVVAPYCRFVELGPRASELATSCTPPSAKRAIWAVLGNHDHTTRGSGARQRETVPEFVANWRMNREVVEVHEAAPGVSLVLADSERLLRGDVGRLGDAVAAAPGPWRILVAHHPLVPDRGGDRSEAETRAHAAVANAGVPVQLALSGHEHNLQAYLPGGGGPALQIIAGGGAVARDLDAGNSRRVFAKKARGFARVSLLPGPPEQLRVEIFSVPVWRLPGTPPIRREAAWDVSIDGAVSRR